MAARAPEEGMSAIESRSAASIRIVERVADKEGVDPADLPPLYNVIDPDALDSLLTTPRYSATQPLTVKFNYEGYSVTIQADGKIELSPRS